MRSSHAIAALLAGLLGTVSCGDKAAPDDGQGPDLVDDTGDGGTDGDDGGDDSGEDTHDPFCDDQPVVTYANFGKGFMVENCQGCHASTAPNRYDAPESVTFDDVDQCWYWSPRILARSTSDEPDMPPSGGVHSEDRTLLEIWLRCADEGT